MNHYEDRIARYRKRADDTRRKARTLPDCETRQVMLDVAATWDRLADYEENRIPFSANQLGS